MLQLTISAVEKYYGSFHALKNVSIEVEDGAFVALIGPSGCGKSTLLRTIAGLEDISSGTISIAGEQVNDRPPRQRDIAMVFQTYALYPHMNVADNMSYSLRLRRRPAAEVSKAVEDVAKTLGLSDLLKRYPRELSGGQRQRVAMGRAIVRNPKLFLFDEPLSNLDAELRVRMRAEVRAIHDRLRATSVYVTHDQVEAMTMADHVVVLRAGVVEQQGAPLDLYDNPANRFVASFIGSPAMNFLDGTTSADGQSVVLENCGVVLPLGRTVAKNREISVGLRPEQLAPNTSDSAVGMPATVASVEATGSQAFVHTEIGSDRITFVVNGRTELIVGDHINLGVDSHKIHLFDKKTELAL